MKIKYPIALCLLAVAAVQQASAAEVLCSASGGSSCRGLIPDFPITTPYASTITLATPLLCTTGTALSVAVRVDLTHSYVGDLRITLSAPGGTTTLLNRPTGSTPFGCAGEDVKATFSNAGVAQACSESSIPAVSGTVQVNANPGALAPAAAGAYMLTVADLSNGFEGLVNDWALVPQCPTADIDGNKQFDALTDGLLVIRYLFGLTGPSLTSGAIGPTPSRSTPAEVLQYLDSIRSSLDIDGNGHTDALTDGLMLIRYLFGLRGPSLIAGAIGAGASRTTSAAIESYLAALTQ